MIFVSNDIISEVTVLVFHKNNIWCWEPRNLFPRYASVSVDWREHRLRLRVMTVVLCDPFPLAKIPAGCLCSEQHYNAAHTYCVGWSRLSFLISPSPKHHLTEAVTDNNPGVTSCVIGPKKDFLFCTTTNKCTVISQIITFFHVSTLSCHLQGACNQRLGQLHKYLKRRCW